MEKRYHALRIIATVYKVFGIITIALAFLLSSGICVSSVLGGSVLGLLTGDRYNNFSAAGGMGLIFGLVIGFTALILYGGLGLTLYAVGEGIYLFLAMEENTRASVLWLQRQSPPPLVR